MTLRKHETASEVQPQLVKVHPRRNNIFPLDLECMLPEGEKLLPPDLPRDAEEHYVHPGQRWPQLSKDSRKNLQHEQKVSIATEESQVSPKIARPEQVFTIFPPGRRREGKQFRLIRLGEYVSRQSSSFCDISPRVEEHLCWGDATSVATSILGNVS